MIKVIENECKIEGYKADVICELQIAIMQILPELNKLDKYIMLHIITSLINKSLEGEDDHE